MTQLLILTYYKNDDFSHRYAETFEFKDMKKCLEKISVIDKSNHIVSAQILTGIQEVNEDFRQ